MPFLEVGGKDTETDTKKIQRGEAESSKSFSLWWAAELSTETGRRGFRGLKSVGKVHRVHGCEAFNRVPNGLNKGGLAR